VKRVRLGYARGLLTAFSVWNWRILVPVKILEGTLAKEIASCRL